MMGTEEVNGDIKNDHMNGDNNIPATFLLASFVSNAKTAQLTPALKDKVKEVLLDYGKYPIRHTEAHIISC